MQKMTVSILAALALFFAAAAADAQDCTFKTGQDGSFSQALKDFHDVLAEVVHGPAQEGDLTPARAKAGDFARLRDGILSATLPEKLAKRCADVSARAAAFSKAVDLYVNRSKGNAPADQMKAALDEVHTAYRNLNSSLTSLEDLLESFHEVLHPLWHDAYPNKDAATIKAEIPKLKVRAKLIMSTAEESDKSKAEAARALLEAVTTLEEAAAADDDVAVLEALRIAHDKYEKLAEG